MNDIHQQAHAHQSLCWSVSGLINAITDTLQARFSSVSVKGEISNLSQAGSGHCYFILKDENNQIRCAMFQRTARMLSFKPNNGDEVEIRGRLAIYGQRGELQLIVESMRPVGQGRLLEQFQQLKAKLEQEGLFDAQRKSSLLAYPKTIGVISSLQAAALQDVLTSLARRAPHVHVIIYPASVQGVQATQELVNAISMASQRNEVDVLLLCRGGGSLEDLWCFNEEALVRAVADCAIPIIAGVGHETDFTLVDFAADVRAPTPTAAAELATPPLQELTQHIEQCSRQLNKLFSYRLENYTYRIDRASLALKKPAQLLYTQQQKLEQLALRMKYTAIQSASAKNQLIHVLATRKTASLQHLLQNKHNRLQQATQRWDHLAAKQLANRQQQLKELSMRLNALNPAHVLSRGYAWISNTEGQTINFSKKIRAGELIQAQFIDGQLQAKVIQSTPDLFAPLLETTDKNAS